MHKIAITNLDTKVVLNNFPSCNIVHFEPWGFSKNAIQKDLRRACREIFDVVEQQEIDKLFGSNLDFWTTSKFRR